MDKKELNELRSRYDAGEHEFIPEILHLFEETLAELAELEFIYNELRTLLGLNDHLKTCGGCNGLMARINFQNTCEVHTCNKCENCCRCISE